MCFDRLRSKGERSSGLYFGECSAATEERVTGTNDVPFVPFVPWARKIKPDFHQDLRDMHSESVSWRGICI